MKYIALGQYTDPIHGV